MSPKTSPWIVAGIAAVAAAAFALLVRLPMPFDGFAALVAAGLALLGTLTGVAWLPRRWVWTETEDLHLAFSARHGVSAYAAGSALEAITAAHARATTLRTASARMRKDVAERVHAIADRLDTAAREIFYAPDRHRELRAVLIRSELIEDAAKAHGALRLRGHAATEDTSRAKLIAALDALDAAFDETDLLAARGLLAEVETASDVAEILLKPRHRTQR